MRTSEAIAVRYADVVVADNKGIQDYVKETYGKDAALIAYGGDHAIRNIDEAKQLEVLKKYNVERGNYAITVCRIEPENNCHQTLEAFAKSDKRLIFIGNWEHSNYGKELKEKYSSVPNISIVDPVYDLDTLHCLRSNAGYYIHGHSAGGTNPSLVEAMFFGCPILCYDVVYNRETTNHEAYYWKNADELLQLLKRTDLNGKPMVDFATTHYTWKRIAKQYEALY